MVLAFAHQKGGTGKSTLAIATSIWLARRGFTVILLDADSQGTSSAWGRRYGASFAVDHQALKVRLLSKDVRELKLKYDHVIIDLPPTVTPQTEKAIEVADSILIPMRPSNADLWALDRLVALILVSDRKPPPPYRVVFTQCKQEQTAAFIAPLKTRKVEASAQCIPFENKWTALFDGKSIDEDMDEILDEVLSELLPVSEAALH